MNNKATSVVRLSGIVSQPKIPPYTGEYSVTPNTYRETVLPTKGMKMTSDVTVGKIPVHEVENESGITLIIGDEYYEVQ